MVPAHVTFHRPLYWRSKRNSPLDVRHKKIAGTHVHSGRLKRRVKFGVAGEVLRLMYMEREEKSGPDYHPTSSGLRKWASQRGSIYIGDQKLSVEHPRLRGPEGEVGLRTYEQLKNRGGFSEELLAEVLRGMSARKYEETVTNAGKAFGVTPSSVSRHLVEATAKQLKQFQERSLEDFSLFAMYLDTVHRGGQAFVVALGVDLEGKKLPLGFWEGATENHEICEELLEGLERRGLKLSKRVLWVTDGGGGIIKALKDRYGKKLIHQRCTLHKDRNIQRHLPKRYRKQAHHLFATALEQNSYKDAKKMLQEFERWLRTSTSRRQNSSSHSRSTDAPQVEGPCSTAQEPALDESYREHVLHGSQLRAQHQTLP